MILGVQTRAQVMGITRLLQVTISLHSAKSTLAVVQFSFSQAGEALAPFQDYKAGPKPFFVTD